MQTRYWTIHIVSASAEIVRAYRRRGDFRTPSMGRREVDGDISPETSVTGSHSTLWKHTSTVERDS